MASIFTPCEGGVFAVTESCRQADTAAFLTIDDSEFKATSVPVTGFDLELNTSQQFLHTLDKFIYVYAFGDRIGTCTFSGVAFTDCTTCAPSPDALYQYYINKRLGKNAAGGGGSLSATNIRMPGGRILLGFLTGLKTSVPSPAYPIVQWALQYHVIIGKVASTNAGSSRTGSCGSGGGSSGGGGGGNPFVQAPFIPGILPNPGGGTGGGIENPFGQAPFIPGILPNPGG